MEQKFTVEELQAMEQMLKTFSKMQSERHIDPEDYDDEFNARFNNAMCALIDFMYLTDASERIVFACGY